MTGYYAWFVKFKLINSVWVCLLTNSLLLGIKAPARDYSVPGTSTSKIFTTIGASANLVFAYNTGMLPEIQVWCKLILFLPRDFCRFIHKNIFIFKVSFTLFGCNLIGDDPATSCQEHDESPILSVYRWSSTVISGYLCRVLGIWIFNTNFFAE
jgi:hypothetical protein